MKHVILIGFMGCGKTTVGRKLAKALKAGFVDTDDLIEKQSHMKISKIFEEYGESYFRDLETLTLRQLLSEEEKLVIAVGGGLPMREENQEYLKELGTVVYLTAQVDTLVKRLEGDTTRPILQGGSLEKKIRKLMAERKNVYERTSKIEIPTDEKGYRQIVEEIKAYVGRTDLEDHKG